MKKKLNQIMGIFTEQVFYTQAALVMATLLPWIYTGVENMGWKYRGERPPLNPPVEKIIT